MKETRPQGLRLRFWLLAAVLVPVNAFWIIQSEVVRYAGHPTTASLLYNAIFWLCLLLAFNGIVRRIAPRAALAYQEMLALYAVLGVTSALGGHDTAEVLLPILARPAQYADKVNGWAEILLPNLPPWMAVLDKDALDPFFSGHSSLYLPGHWRAWLVPILVWSGFMGTMAGVMLCLNVLLRRQWTERERLAFPLVQIPLELAQPRAPILRNRMFWLGALVAAGLQLWNGLAIWNPSLPMIPLKYVNYGGANISQRPWSAIGWLPVGFYPFAIALGVLLPLDLSFSSWFFFWFWKMQAVITAAAGWDQIPDFPYVREQSLGAFLGIAASSLWLARNHLRQIVLHFLEPSSVPVEDADEPISYRAAMLGVLLGTGMLFGFCLLAGMRPGVIAAFFLIYFAIALAITRMRAELGPPVHDLHYAGPDTFLPKVLGPTSLGRQDLTLFSFFWGFNRAYRAHPMPVELEGFKIAQQSRLAMRPLFVAMLLAGLLGPLCAFWAILHLGYAYGAAGAIGPPNVLTIFGSEAWNRYTGWVRTPQPPETNVGIAALIGMSFTFGLNALRLRIIGFPFHPVGYAIASSWGMSVLWVPMLLAWIIKGVLLRYGGLGLYRRSLPFFYGVIVGECVAGSLWSLFGVITGLPTYGFWP